MDKIDRQRLSGPKQAALILEDANTGLSEDEILALLYHDEKLVEALHYFLVHTQVL